MKDDEIREYISRMCDTENKKVIIQRKDIEFLAGINVNDYEKFKLELYLYTLLNDYKVIPEHKLALPHFWC